MPFFLTTLEDLKEILEDRPGTIETEDGVHGVTYVYDEVGEYAVIGYNLPQGMYAEIDGNTYGEMQGVRVYLQST